MPVNTAVGTKSTDTVAVAVKADGRSDTTRQHHLRKVTLAPQCLYVAEAGHSKHRLQYLCEAEYKTFFCSSLVYYQSSVIDVSSSKTRFSSIRVRIPAALGGDNKKHQFTTDSATDMPCIAQNFIRNHARLRCNRVLLILSSAISLLSGDDLPVNFLGYKRFALKLNNKSLPVEA